MGALGDFRSLVAGRLAELEPEDWAVYPTVVDAVEPPAFMLEWSTTTAPAWLLPSSFCRYSAYLDVVMIAGRVDVEPGIELLETMLERAVVVLDGVTILSAAAPGPLELGGLHYLAARLTLLSPLTLNGGSENA